jgi:murein DD-endopeptidase MepM/ murein hydrolase activator NlpD
VKTESQKSKKNKKKLIVLSALVIILPALLISFLRLEGEEPVVQLNLASDHIGKSGEIILDVSDTRSGLKHVWVALLKNGNDLILLDDGNYPSKNLLGDNGVHQKRIKILIHPVKLGIGDGQATLRIVVRDASWRRWFQGNRTYLEKEIVIDSKPPVIEILSRVHNITQGGSALIVYKLSEPCSLSGVMVGDNFFPGRPISSTKPGVLAAFFALRYNQGPGTLLFVKAVDQAGNPAQAGFSHHIRKKRFKKDLIKLSDGFLNWKMPEFDLPEVFQKSALEKFLFINRDLRKKNYQQMQAVGAKSEPVVYWEGSFLRLPNSANRAGYADERDYLYKGKIVDHQVHLGIDLASLQKAPIPAANGGRVAFADFLGIYGKTVMIDHGFGLFSTYSHLSAIDVLKGHLVAKGEIIGHTGLTGLAGGDHLHFGIFIHNTAVTPVEWWDAAWIKNNIADKLALMPGPNSSVKQ